MRQLPKHRKSLFFLAIFVILTICIIIQGSVSTYNDWRAQRMYEEYDAAVPWVDVYCNFIDYKCIHEEDAHAIFVVAEDVYDFNEEQKDYFGHKGDISAAIYITKDGRTGNLTASLPKGKYTVITGGIKEGDEREVYDIEVDDIEGGYELDIDCKNGGTMNLRPAKEQKTK